MDVFLFGWFLIRSRKRLTGDGIESSVRLPCLYKHRSYYLIMGRSHTHIHTGTRRHTRTRRHTYTRRDKVRTVRFAFIVSAVSQKNCSRRGASEGFPAGDFHEYAASTRNEANAPLMAQIGLVDRVLDDTLFDRPE